MASATQDTKTSEHLQLNECFGAHNYHPLPVVIESGKGAWVTDVEGNKYLDMLSAYSALNFGYSHERLIAAATKQLNKVTLTSRAFHNDQLGPWCREICELTGFEAALPMNSGAEACETAIKMARKWGYEKKGVAKNQAEIICAKGNFHGRTTTIISFSTDEQYKAGFGPYTPGFPLVPFGDASAVEAAMTKNTVAVFVEPIQAESGILVPKDGYLKALRDICTKHNVLLIFDEIQTGLCRTGDRFAWQHEGEDARPDAMCLGKALGGGVLPISAVVSSREAMDVFHPGDHGSTFGGNPLACAVSRVAMDMIRNDGLDERSREMGAHFKSKLQAVGAPAVKEIRGRGLLIGVQIKPEYPKARWFCERFMAEGILCKDAHEDVIRFAPPLIIEKSDIDWAMDRIAPALLSAKTNK
ncbi:MAG: ornithine--oxo-acid transaminase [Phycisphaerales bacterium]|nr:ornithine--oxo-acid transaminase [Phycisphaerales bacterium]MCB9864483.1 ornithine--oxo-acid transaminase [Phycisphaerales bacterium]